MRKFRIHNDIPITWRIVDKQTLLPFDLEGKTVRLSLQTRFGMISIEDFTVSGNVISFVFKASQQSTLGVYTATASITDAEGHTWTMDACQMLELVSQSCCADVCGSHGVDGTSGVEFQQVIFVDSELNAESKNPVSNSAVTKAIQGIKSDAFATDEKINREIEERKAENNVLSLRINQEETERKASDDSLGERIDSSVTSLEGLILEEGKTREEADNALLEKINHETDERKESESLLYGRIEEESNQRKEAYDALDARISEEVEARKAADLATGDRINTLGDKAIQTSPQNFSEEQKAQARENIGAPSKVGHYPKMSVGFSENISGDGSAVDAEFTFRPTAGENRNILNDGAARIKSIKGNSLVINNYLRYYIAQKGYFLTKYDDGSFLVKRNPEVTSGVYFSDFWKVGSTIKGHKYAIFVYYTASNILDGEKLPIYIYGPTTGQFGPVITKNGSGVATVIITCDSVVETNVISYSPSNNQELLVKKRVVIDLTRMFISGNEPTTIEEFYDRKPSNIDIYANNEGEIINNNVVGIKTVGFNQFNGKYAKVVGGVKYYLGGTYTSIGFATELGGEIVDIAIPSDRYYTSSQPGYIYAQGTDICINLSWPEYAHLNGTYQPYKPFSRDLSWVKKYFPEGMRSAGSVRDEIRFNHSTQKWEAVQNIGVRAYKIGDESDSTVTTDGSNTNYAVATPVVTEITEDVNLDYDCSDYGTEQILSDIPSAPISADIVYQPNALATIKNVPDLMARISALEQALTSLQSTQVEEKVIE